MLQVISSGKLLTSAALYHLTALSPHLTSTTQPATMCIYDVPVVQWLHCGHVQSMAVVRQRSSCHDDAWRAFHSGAPPCSSATYHGQPVYVQGPCPSCCWSAYYQQLDRLDLYGSQAASMPPRPGYLIPLYSNVSWRAQWQLIGMSPSQTHIDSTEHNHRIQLWVAGQRDRQTGYLGRECRVGWRSG